MAYGPQTGAKSVSTAGSRVRLTSTDIYSEAVLIIADSDNSGDIYVGGDDVSSSNGIVLSPGKSLSMDAPANRGTDEGINLNEVYLDSAQNGDSVRYMYFEKVPN